MGDLQGKTAIILLGHGSRVPDAGKNMDRVAVALKERHGHEIVEVCYLSRLGPHFPEAFKRCVDQGADRVMVIPYFLHDGLHLVLDIPEMMQEVADQYPCVRLVLGKNLGFDDLLVELVEKRIEESIGCQDVRKLVLPARDKYPLPPGQCEFVPMDAEEARRYLRKHRVNTQRRRP
jgi:sirohydrochlorin ferrochelatase